MSACNNCWFWQSLDREHLQQHAVIFVQRGIVTWMCALVVHWGEQSTASDWRFKERWRPRFWSHHFGSGIIVGSGNHLIVNTCNMQLLLQRGITAEGNYYVNARTLCSEYSGEQSNASFEVQHAALVVVQREIGTWMCTHFVQNIEGNSLTLSSFTS